jgi:PAS domain S-box-containing protein
VREELAVILLDVVMPTMDGFETAAYIRKREASKHIPIIFLTANAADVDLIYRGYSVGAVDYLVKPLDPEIVKAKVAVFVDLFRKTQRIRRQEEALRAAERRRGEEALRENEALFEATFTEAGVGIAHASTDGRWLRVNPRFCQILGYSRDELRGMRLQDVTHPADVASDVAALHELLLGKRSTHRTDLRCLHKDGRVVWVNLTISLMRNAAGEPRTFIVVLEDITGRKRGEQRQRFLTAGSEALLSSLDYRTTLEAVARLAVAGFADWCVVELASTEQAGLDQAAALAHADPQKMEPLRRLRRKLAASAREPGGQLGRGRPQLFEEPTAASSGDGLGFTRDPETLALLAEVGASAVIAAPLLVRGRALGILTFGVGDAGRNFVDADLALAGDLAHRIAFAIENAWLYQQAQTAIQARDEFLSIASHELRTPLTPLQIVLDRLMRVRDDDRAAWVPERLRPALERCERQVLRLETLIDNLLDVSRIASGRLSIQPEEVDLTELMREVTTRFADQLAAAGCKLELLSNGPVLGNWDRLRIEQVVTNLLTNAIKYGGGKPVEAQVAGTRTHGRVSIRDHGIGIAPGELTRIFGRFERAVSSRSYGGLGLGLYIARQIVDAHGGEIRADSKPGQGSVFTLELPRSGPPAAAADEEDQEEEGGKEERHDAAAHPD